MTDNNNKPDDKIKLNLSAQGYVPKFMMNNNPPTSNPVPNQNQYNPNFQNSYNPMMMGVGGNQMYPMQGGYNYQQNPYQMNNQQMQPQQQFKPNEPKKESNKKLNNVNTNNQGNQKKPQDKPQQQAKPAAKKVEKTDKDKKDKEKEKVDKEKAEKEKAEKEKEKEKALEKELEDIDLDVYSKEGKMVDVDETREPASIVFIGHVDHGKSTICGNILLLTGQVDERTIEKYQKEAKQKNRESWYLAYLMDQNDEEKEKGKTVEIGKANFSLNKKRFSILDAPGHKGYLPNLLIGACQADFAALVISAKEGEFEGGFEKGGSTREHALLAKSLGVTKLVILVNKMDEETVKWSEKRFNNIKSSLTEYLKKIGFKESDTYFVPISGLYGDNMKERKTNKLGWYTGETLFDTFDNLEVPKRDFNAPLRFSILDRYRDGGMQILGKVESGTMKFGATYTLMPSKVNIDIQWIFNNEENGVPYAKAGETIRAKIKGADGENDVQRGYIVCAQDDLCASFTQIIAEVWILELTDVKPIISNGFSCVMHYHTIITQCTIDTIMCEIDKKTLEEKKNVKFIKNYTRAKVLIKCDNIICGEKFEKNQSLGRFTLRDEDKTIAVGRVLKYKL